MKILGMTFVFLGLLAIALFLSFKGKTESQNYNLMLLASSGILIVLIGLLIFKNKKQ